MAYAFIIERTPFPWGGIKIIGWGKTPCKSHPTLRVSIVCIGVQTRRVPPSPADTDLVKSYEDYNAESVAKHKNADDLYSEAMVKISAPNARNVDAAVKKAQEQTVASQASHKGQASPAFRQIREGCIYERMYKEPGT